MGTSSVFFVLLDVLFVATALVVVAFSAGISPPDSSLCLHSPRILSTSPAFSTVSKTSFDTVVSPRN